MLRQRNLPDVSWQRLRGRKLGPNFRKQQPIAPYAADVRSSDVRPAVGADGGIHNGGEQSRRDVSRNSFVKDNGYRVLRMAAADILRDIAAVTTVAVTHAARPLHHSPAASGFPSRTGEE